jgi:hypothetical protein
MADLQGFEDFDRVLAAARAHGLRVIITLANAWDDFGGIRQYLAWAGRRKGSGPRPIRWRRSPGACPNCSAATCRW